MVRDAQIVFLFGSGLLILMAMATVAVLVGGRMADQSRRVGLLKAVGATPQLVAVVLLAEHLVVALFSAGIGLTAGWLAALLLIEPSVGLLGVAAPSMNLYTVAFVTGVAVMVAATSTFVPAVRAARTSTVVALADSPRTPKRSRWLIALSSRLPPPLLLGLRTMARRPRRVVLSILGVAVTVSGLVAAVAASAGIDEQLAAGGYRAASVERLWPMLMAIMATLATLAAVNSVFIAWATVLDTRRATAVARALGATPRQVSIGLATAQVVPALAGAILAVPAGIALVFVLDDSVPTLPPLWQLASVALIAVGVIALLTAIPARTAGRRSIAEILPSEHV
jgi:putative ABC transport system permease protein